jgi:hypothetical protein
VLRYISLKDEKGCGDVGYREAEEGLEGRVDDEGGVREGDQGEHFAKMIMMLMLVWFGRIRGR